MSATGPFAWLHWHPAVAYAAVMLLACLAFANSLEGALMYDDEGVELVVGYGYDRQQRPS